VKQTEMACLPRSFVILGENLKLVVALSYSTKGGRGN